jgi:hypothetical protein
MRKRLAGKPDPLEVTKAEKKIAALKERESQGEIHIKYFDESGFSLTPSVPYAWQNIGERIELRSSRSAQINVAGFLDIKNNTLTSWTFECNIDSVVVSAVFDKLAESIEKETWVILDNASFHKSNIIDDKIAEWEDKKLFLYYLPPYSPQLNMIERVWQFMKYQWMPLSAYNSFQNMRESVNSMLSGYGSKHLITFA